MKVNISPGVGIIKIFKALDYESWFALAEFIDNSISSYLKEESEIRKVELDYKLKIELELNFIDNSISIKDNAGGILTDKFEYAFRAAEVPDDTTGLNEFGMGMKTASSWLANKWTVRTSAFGEDVERVINFNVNEVVENDLQELLALERNVPFQSHYTTIKLEELTSNAPSSRDLNKIKKHLSSIYRKFLRRNDIEILLNGEKLEFQEQEILKVPRYDNESGEPIEWKINIDQKFGNDKRVVGYIGLLNTMSTSVYNGFSLFRRGRVIEGSGDDLFRPKQLSGQVGSHQYKRVFGELELDGFHVDFKKGKFQVDQDFEVLMDLLQDYCDDNDFPLLRQARNYRKPAPKESLKELAIKGAKDYRDSIDKAEIQRTIDDSSVFKIPVYEEKIFSNIPEKNKLEQIIEKFDIDGETWVIELELTDNSETLDWIEIMEEIDLEMGMKKIKVRLSLIHPFMSSFGTDDIQPFIRLAIALAISESLARMSGGGPGTVRRNLNSLLRTVLSR